MASLQDKDGAYDLIEDDERGPGYRSNHQNCHCPKGLLCRGPSNLMMCVCLSVCLSVTLRSKLDRFRNGLCSFTSSKAYGKYCFHNISQEKRYFCNLFKIFFFTFFAIFSCIGFIIFKIFREIDKNMQFRVVYYSRNPRNLFGM